MEENRSQFPTIILKVDLNCCSKCPFKVKKTLQQINGVYSIEINAKKGLVQVSGTADPSVLREAIKNIGNKAELLVHEKDSHEAKKKLDELRKNRQCTKDCRSKDRDCCAKGKDTTSSSSDPDGGCCHAESKLHENKAVNDSVPYPVYGIGGFDPAYYGGYRGISPSGYAMPYHATRPHGYPGYHPAIRGGLPQRPPPPHSLPPPPPSLPPKMRLPLSNLYVVLSGQKDPPVGNSLYHSFSDENVKACTIV